MNGNVFAGFKSFVVEMAARFVRRASGNIVVESPTAAWTVNEVAETVLTARTSPYDAAGVLVLSGKLAINPGRGIQRRYQDIGGLGSRRRDDRGRAPARNGYSESRAAARC